MRIDSSSISMFSTRSYIEQYQKSERLNYWVGNRSSDGQSDSQSQIEQQNKGVVLEISNLVKETEQNCVQDISEVEEENILSEKDQLKVQLIEKFIEILTGKKIKINVPKLNLKSQNNCPNINIERAQEQQPRSAGWGLEYDFHERIYEREAVTFKAEGIIKTADGKEVKFSIDLNMTREFLQEQNISVRAGDAKKVDPLVINYAGTAASLTNTKYSFDLDSDGAEDQISFAGEGSGFLAVDKNGDGTINNGTELFGPSMGNGFEELAIFDEDNNGWIDENDPIFNNLRIWSKDEQGNDYLFALGEKGIGAIYLGNIDTMFSIKDSSNELQGQVAETGIFVKESGTVGTIQHIDLVI